MNYDTPLVQQQLLKEGILEEKDVQAPIVNNLNIEPKGNLAGQIAATPLALAGFLGADLIPGYTDMTDYVREKAFVPQTQYTGPEFMEKMQADTNKAIEAIEASQDLNADQKTQLTDLVNTDMFNSQNEFIGSSLNPQYFNDVQTNDPYNLNSSQGFDNKGFDDYVLERLNRVR